MQYGFSWCTGRSYIKTYMVVLNGFHLIHGGRKLARESEWLELQTTTLNEIERWSKGFEKFPVFWLNGITMEGNSASRRSFQSFFFWRLPGTVILSLERCWGLKRPPTYPPHMGVPAYTNTLGPGRCTGLVVDCASSPTTLNWLYQP